MTTESTLAAIRRGLLALVLLGIVGLLAELVLLEHYEDPWQWTPLALLAVALVATTVVAVRPSPKALRIFRIVMSLCVVAGALGVFLHLNGNVEFERETAAELRGLPLFWAALRGATPTLAPGAMVQLGLLGLAFGWRHPLRLDPRTPASPDQETS